MMLQRWLPTLLAGIVGVVFWSGATLPIGLRPRTWHIRHSTNRTGATNSGSRNVTIAGSTSGSISFKVQVRLGFGEQKPGFF
jgi:hypothetical protein